MKNGYCLGFFLLLFVFTNAQLIDRAATDETVGLYNKLKSWSSKGVLFGHQHAREYGHGWEDRKNTSDVKLVTGSNPAVIGFDFMVFDEKDPDKKDRGIKQMRKLMADTYDRGGVVTIAWHAANPVLALNGTDKGNGFNWEEGYSNLAVPEILPGAPYNVVFKAKLKVIGEFVKSVKGKDGKPVPMIFRPFHEMDGSWFWWGRTHRTAEEYKELWKFTVQYLRDSLNVHQFIYAYSPDCGFQSKESYLIDYPGGEYVDMLGMDNYNDLGRYGKYDIEAAKKKLQILGEVGKEFNKLIALTETGLESIVKNDWYTTVLLPLLKDSKLPITYVLVWRNDIYSATHFYAPYPGHASVPDFIKFYNDPYTIFESDLKPAQ